MNQNSERAGEAKALEKILDVFSLPLISQFRYYQFNGLADGTVLVPNFNPADVLGKTIVIKSVKIVPYYQAGAVVNQDFYITDGATVNEELLPGNCRVNRLFDVYSYGCLLELLINGSAVPVFPNSAPIVPPLVGGNCTLDLDIDNLFYKHSVKANSLDVTCDAQIFNVLNVPAIVIPNVKVFIGCYLI